MDHQFQKSPSSSLSFQQLTNLTLQQYCNYLKEYRLKVQPPFKDQPHKKLFCKSFDKIILKRCLQQISVYAQAKRTQKKQREKQKSKIRKQSNEDISPPIKNIECNSTQPYRASRTLIDKLMLYTWQLTNFRTIYSCQQINEEQTGTNSDSFILSNQLIHDLHHFCVSTCRFFLCAWGVKAKTMQAMMIAYFNLLKNGVIEPDLTRNMSLGCLIQAVLGDVTRSIQHQASQPSKQPVRKRSHSQQKPNLHTAAQLQLQFFCYILQLCSKKTSQFIQQAYLQLSNNIISKPTLISNSFLHFVSLLLNKMINDRITTEIVQGYQSQVQDVRKMYDNREGKCGRFYLEWADYQWIVGGLLGVVMEGYKGELREMWWGNKQVDIKQKKQLKEFPKQINDIHGTNRNEDLTHSSKKIRSYNRMYAEAVLNIIGIINCCTFLGGYSRQLQKKTTDLVMSNALEFLEISYIIYELCHAKKRNISVGSSASLQQAYKQNLYSLLHSACSSTIKKEGQLNSTQIHENSENLSKPILPPLPTLPLQQCQLVSILRLLSNLVHINPEAQKYFQDNLKYFRIVMSLTHECETEITMKNWAIVFLRNVAERSSIMRQELEKLKIDVKVDNGFEMKVELLRTYSELSYQK